MTAQQCPKCEGKGYIRLIYDPPGNVRIPCDCTHADPAFDNAQQGAREGDVKWPTKLDAEVMAHHLDVVDFLKSERDLANAEVAVLESNITGLLHQLAAKDAELTKLRGQALSDQTQYVEAQAEIERLRDAIKGAHILSNHATRMIQARDTLIRQLTDALRRAGDRLATYHRKGSPTMNIIREAIAEAETTSGEQS